MNEDDGGIQYWQEVGQYEEYMARLKANVIRLMALYRRSNEQQALALDEDFNKWLDNMEKENGTLR